MKGDIRMEQKQKLKGLCSTCTRFPNCTFCTEQDFPVLFCDEFTDTDLNSGDIAIHVVVHDQEPARALFDNLKVWEVELR